MENKIYRPGTTVQKDFIMMLFCITNLSFIKNVQGMAILIILQLTVQP